MNTVLQKNHFSSFYFLKILALYLPVVVISIIIHNKLVDTPFLDERAALHEQVIAGNAPAPIQYRVFIHYLAEALTRTGMSVKTAYLLLRGLFTLLSALLLHYFLKKWFETKVCIIGVLLFLGAVPVTYLNYYMQPMDMPNLAFFIAGYMLIEKRKDLWFGILLFFAMFNRETIVFLPVAWLLYRYDELKIRPLFLRFASFGAVSLGAYIALRFIFGIMQHYSFASYLLFNLKHVRTYIYALLFFGYPLFHIAAGWGGRPKFIRRAVLFMPFLIFPYWIFGIMEEPRLWLPAFPVVIASGLASIFGMKSGMEQDDDSGPLSSVLTGYGKYLYAALLACFIACVMGYNYYYNRLHVKNLTPAERAEIYMKEGCFCLGEGYIKDAEERFLKAESLDPDNPGIVLLLGEFYCRSKPDREKALKYLQHYREIGTDKDELNNAEGLIRRLKN